MASQEEHDVGSGDVDVQCNHAKSLGAPRPADYDPIMEKQDWDLDAWNHVYGKMVRSINLIFHLVSQNHIHIWFSNVGY